MQSKKVSNPLTPTQRRTNQIEAMLELTREFFNRCDAIKFLETQQEMVSCYMLMEQERLANDMGKFPSTIENELHRTHIQSIFLLKLEKIFEQIETT